MDNIPFLARFSAYFLEILTGLSRRSSGSLQEELVILSAVVALVEGLVTLGAW